VARRPDQKTTELARCRTLNPHPEAVRDELFGTSAFFDARDLVQVKYEMLRKVERGDASVAAAAAAFGLSRQTYYSAAAALADRGLPGLLPAKPGPRRAHKLSDEVLDFTESLLARDPALSSADLARAIEERFALHVHRRSVERALGRRGDDGRPKSG
jgi:transposase